MVRLDPDRFPRAAEYVASLPQGFESYPVCKIRDIVLEPYVQTFASVAGEPGLPAPVADMLAGRATGSWMPEVLFQVAHLAVRDRAFEDDAPMADWMLEANARVFDKPILRNLMRLVSPSLIVLGATKRWSAFHLGSDLTVDRVVESGGRAQAMAHLKYPPGLFSPHFLVTLERSFMAALSASRAREPIVKALTVESERGVTDYAVSWRA